GVQVCWVIVSHEEGRGFVERYSEGGSMHPMEEIVGEILAVVDAAGGDVWVALSKKRLGVASRLHTAGVPVTLIMHPRNRAAERVRLLVESFHARQQMVASRLGWRSAQKSIIDREAVVVSPV